MVGRRGGRDFTQFIYSCVSSSHPLHSLRLLPLSISSSILFFLLSLFLHFFFSSLLHSSILFKYSLLVFSPPFVNTKQLCFMISLPHSHLPIMNLHISDIQYILKLERSGLNLNNRHLNGWCKRKWKNI